MLLNGIKRSALEPAFEYVLEKIQIWGIEECIFHCGSGKHEPIYRSLHQAGDRCQHILFVLDGAAILSLTQPSSVRSFDLPFEGTLEKYIESSKTSSFGCFRVGEHVGESELDLNTGWLTNCILSGAVLAIPHEEFRRIKDLFPQVEELIRIESSLRRYSRELHANTVLEDSFHVKGKPKAQVLEKVAMAVVENLGELGLIISREDAIAEVEEQARIVSLEGIGRRNRVARIIGAHLMGRLIRSKGGAEIDFVDIKEMFVNGKVTELGWMLKFSNSTRNMLSQECVNLYKSVPGKKGVYKSDLKKCLVVSEVFNVLQLAPEQCRIDRVRWKRLLFGSKALLELRRTEK